MIFLGHLLTDIFRGDSLYSSHFFTHSVSQSRFFKTSSSLHSQQHQQHNWHQKSTILTTPTPSTPTPPAPKPTRLKPTSTRLTPLRPTQSRPITKTPELTIPVKTAEPAKSATATPTPTPTTKQTQPTTPTTTPPFRLVPA